MLGLKIDTMERVGEIKNTEPYGHIMHEQQQASFESFKDTR
jgi:hypothetical protein